MVLSIALDLFLTVNATLLITSGTTRIRDLQGIFLNHIKLLSCYGLIIGNYELRNTKFHDEFA